MTWIEYFRSYSFEKSRTRRGAGTIMKSTFAFTGNISAPDFERKEREGQYV